MKTAFSALLLCGILCLTACAADQPANEAPAQWTQDSVAGLIIELTDPIRVEWMRFSAHGYVDGSVIGQKDGPVTGPGLKWRLINGRLQIYDGQQVFEQLTLVSRDSTTIVARRHNGQTAKYKIRRYSAAQPLRSRLRDPADEH